MDLILYRTHKFDAEARSFCERLQTEADLPVVCLVDETKRVVDVSPFSKISVTRAALRERGLLATDDAPWRCGDYGLYLALDRFPDVQHFWLVEYDVRIHAQERLSSFFSAFRESKADLIAPFLTPRDEGWWWRPAMQVRNLPVWGCLFPLLRASAPLLTSASEARRRQSASPVYRLFWPNDESFLATTAVRGGFSVADLSADTTWYTDESFSFERPWSGHDLASSEPDGLIYHPVLYGDDLQRKLTQLAKPTRFSEKACRKVRRLARWFA